MALLLTQGTALGSMLFMNYGFSHDESIRVERIAAWILFVAAAGALVRPVRLLSAGILLAGAVVFSWTSVNQGGYPFSDLAFAAHAIRLATPLAVLLTLLPLFAANRYRAEIVLWVSMVAAATTFIVHGIEALLAHPWFVDMIIITARDIPGWTIRQSTAEQMLIVVGVVDVLSALMLLLLRSRAAALWMAFWGAVTCCIRITSFGVGALPDAIVRLPQFLLPLSIFVMLRSRYVLSTFRPPAPPARTLHAT